MEPAEPVGVVTPIAEFLGAVEVWTGAVVALVALGIVGAALLSSEEEEPQPVAASAMVVAMTADTITAIVFFILKND